MCMAAPFEWRGPFGLVGPLPHDSQLCLHYKKGLWAARLGAREHLDLDIAASPSIMEQISWSMVMVHWDGRPDSSQMGRGRGPARGRQEIKVHVQAD